MNGVNLLSQSLWVPPFLFKLTMVQPSHRLEERRQLLMGCGVGVDPKIYEVIRRLLLLLVLVIGTLGYMALRNPALTLFINPVYVITGCCILFILCWFDNKLLEQIQARRAQQIVKEIFVLSHQLLYYSSSNMSLHAKLSRCVPQTRTMRPVVQLMLNEWYQDAEAAIRNFKYRLGTDEAHSFGETLNALRLHENGSYYELLRQRIQDYKEKIELAKESRKETVSYILFMLAGLPILNTFRVFMYPWVIEGQQLFNSIN
ncbi:hypothetical protein D3C73_1047910 [compost metagenome]